MGPEILGSIELGNRNYSEILRSIPYLSHTELNRKLKILIEKDVIKRGKRAITPIIRSWILAGIWFIYSGIWRIWKRIL